VERRNPCVVAGPLLARVTVRVDSRRVSAAGGDPLVVLAEPLVGRLAGSLGLVPRDVALRDDVGSGHGADEDPATRRFIWRKGLLAVFGELD
jgi:hypothetical protein